MTWPCLPSTFTRQIEGNPSSYATLWPSMPTRQPLGR
jgi:hypothetical protein